MTIKGEERVASFRTWGGEKTESKQELLVGENSEKGLTIKIEPDMKTEVDERGGVESMLALMLKKMEEGQKIIHAELKEHSKEIKEGKEMLSVQIGAVDERLEKKMERLNENFEQKLKGFRQELGEELDQKMSNFKSGFDKDFNQLKDEVKEIFKETEHELKEKLNKFENKMEERVECLSKNVEAQASVCEQGKKEVQGYCDQIFKEYRGKVKGEVEEIKETTSKIEDRVDGLEKVVLNKSFAGSPLVVQIRDGSSFNNIGFDPKGNVHPVSFVNSLRSQFTVEWIEKDKLRRASACLKGESLDWGADAPDKYETFEDFVSAFLAEYWSKERQMDVIETFKRAPWYNRRNGESMKEYCERWISKLKHLDSPWNDRDTIEVLMGKLPPNKRCGLIGHNNNVKEFLRRVRDVDRWQTNCSVQENGYSEWYQGDGNQTNRMNQINVRGRGGRGGGNFRGNDRGHYHRGDSYVGNGVPQQ